MTQLGTTDPIVEHLRQRQMPVTLENWLTFAFSGEPPENWQIETEVPLELQDELEEYLNRPSSPASTRDQTPRFAPTPREYAEHKAGRPLSEEELQGPARYIELIRRSQSTR